MPEDCLFCSVVAGDVDATVLRDGERTIVIRDINPQAPTHVLVIPKEHYPDAAAVAAADPALLAALHTEAHAAAQDEGIADSGYRLVYNTGADAQQSVAHVHLHVIGGRSMTWPPG